MSEPHTAPELSYNVHHDERFDINGFTHSADNHCVVLFPSADTGLAEHALFNLSIEKLESPLSGMFNNIEAEPMFAIRLINPDDQGKCSLNVAGSAYDVLDLGLAFANRSEPVSIGEVERDLILEQMQIHGFLDADNDKLDPCTDVIGPCDAQMVENFVDVSRQINTVYNIMRLEHESGVSCLRDDDISRLKNSLNEMFGAQRRRKKVEFSPTNYGLG